MRMDVKDLECLNRILTETDIPLSVNVDARCPNCDSRLVKSVKREGKIERYECYRCGMHYARILNGELKRAVKKTLEVWENIFNELEEIVDKARTRKPLCAYQGGSCDDCILEKSWCENAFKQWMDAADRLLDATAQYTETLREMCNACEEE